MLEKILDIATKLHNGQVRKYSNDPYIIHSIEVADMISFLGDKYQAIALLHDTIEDCDISVDELYDLLLSNNIDANTVKFIVDGVIDLTDVYTKEDFPQLNRKKRKELESDRLGKISPKIQTIKYADMLVNGNSIIENDKKFAKTYILELSILLSKMDKGNSRLKRKLQKMIQKYNNK